MSWILDLIALVLYMHKVLCIFAVDEMNDALLHENIARFMCFRELLVLALRCMRGRVLAQKLC